MCVPVRAFATFSRRLDLDKVGAVLLTALSCIAITESENRLPSLGGKSSGQLDVRFGQHLAFAGVVGMCLYIMRASSTTGLYLYSACCVLIYRGGCAMPEDLL
jgi:hypothetical protein